MALPASTRSTSTSAQPRALTFHQFARLHARQPGYAGSVTVELGEGRQLTVIPWDSDPQAATGLSTLRAEVGRVRQPLMATPSHLIGTGPVDTDFISPQSPS